MEMENIIKKEVWVKWSTICKPNKFEGINIKDIQSFNETLLAKWKWGIL